MVTIKICQTDMNKFISIIWGYPKHLNSFVPEENYHLHVLKVAKELGYKPVILINHSDEDIRACSYFDKDIEIIIKKSFFSYILFLISNRKNIFYVNSYELKSFIVPFLCHRSIFMGHSQVIRQTKLKQLLQQIVFRFFKAIRLNNDAENNFLIKHDKINKDKLFIIPLVVSSETFYFQDKSERNSMVFYGNITKTKNLFTILEALKIIIAKYPNFKLDIIGNVFDDDFLNDVNSMNLKNNVNILGFIPQFDVAKNLNNYLISVNSSISEGQCLAVYESALCGCALCLPKIMSFSGAFKGMALFHDVNNEKTLANNIMYYIENQNLAKEHNKKCREMILKDYTINSIEEKMKDLFLKV